MEVCACHCTHAEVRGLPGLFSPAMWALGVRLGSSLACDLEEEPGQRSSVVGEDGAAGVKGGDAL